MVLNIKVMCSLPLYLTVADRVWLRTVDACEPRQVRKEAAAAGYARVAVLSGSVSSFYIITELLIVFRIVMLKISSYGNRNRCFFFYR